MLSTVVGWFRAAWSYVLRWFQRACGPRKDDKNNDVESRERLLSADGNISAPVQQHGLSTVAAAAEKAAHQSSVTANASAPAKETNVVVMRHGHRQDEEDPYWHQTASRPWDPPLSVTGRQQANAAADTLNIPHIDYLISSPFQRCLQTSAGLVKQLGLQQGQWLVDWQLSEICDPRVLFAGRNVLKHNAQDSMEAWMWNGKTLEQALDEFMRKDCKLQNITVRPAVRATAPPRFPETLEQGLVRYSSAIQDIAQAYRGSTVLVVTHGECVRMAVLMAEPDSEVFEVKHTGFVVLQQQPVKAAAAVSKQQQHVAAGSWKLTSLPGETGVLWLEDD